MVDDATMIDSIAKILDALGPFSAETRRSEKWRTADQLANDLRVHWPELSVERVESALRAHERSPDARIRRATYPDRTTVLPLWGSTRHHGPPWPEQAPAERTDPAEDLPEDLRLPGDRPSWFISHSRVDRELAQKVAVGLRETGLRGWMYETQIAYRGDIAKAVREALEASVGCLALTSRFSMASLWVLTELHTALATDRHVRLLLDAQDGPLMSLFQSVRLRNPEGPFDFEVEYERSIVQMFRSEFEAKASRTRTARYEEQVKDFLSSLPSYLRSGPAIAFPRVPRGWPPRAIPVIDWTEFCEGERFESSEKGLVESLRQTR